MPVMPTSRHQIHDSEGHARAAPTSTCDSTRRPAIVAINAEALQAPPEAPGSSLRAKALGLQSGEDPRRRPGKSRSDASTGRARHEAALAALRAHAVLSDESA